MASFTCIIRLINQVFYSLGLIIVQYPTGRYIVQDIHNPLIRFINQIVIVIYPIEIRPFLFYAI